MNEIKEKFIAKFLRMPKVIPATVSLTCIYGFVILYSAAGGSLHPWAYKQMLTFAVFMPVSIAIAMIDLRIIFRFSYVFYFAVLMLLIIVELFGKSAMGAMRWIDLGIFNVQPSELAKIAVVLMLARYFHSLSEKQLSKPYYHLVALVAVMIPTILIVKQPDLGTGTLTLIVAASIFFAIGLNIAYFLIAALAIIASLPIIWMTMYEYQKNRVLVFLDPSREPLGAGYNIIQSKIAIGSGGMFGKGMMSGTQGHLSFLPEHQTDFIFASLAEEFGFTGGLVLLGLYVTLTVASLSVAIVSRSRFGKIIVVGITTIFFSHVFINIGMVTGLLPAVGIPLPLISYGRTMLVSMLVGFGLVMNVGVHQHTRLF